MLNRQPRKTGVGTLPSLRHVVLPRLLLLLMGAIGSAAMVGTSAYGAISSSASNFHASGPAPAQQPPTSGNHPFDCSQIDKFGIDRQTNIRASQILAQCGRARDTESNIAGAVTSFVRPLLSSPAYGGTDLDIILPDGSPPHLVQSETFTWGHLDTIVVNYNDSRGAPTCYSGISYSTDGGATFTRAGGGVSSPLCIGHANNYGGPIVVWNNALSLWFAGDLTTGCGTQGIGLWTSPDGLAWTAGACAHSGSSDDRESMWVDNNPSSPHYGRMYISWNDFAAGQFIYVTYSDNGTAWSTPVQVSSGGFVRNVQLTGDLLGSGTVFAAAMDEGGGGFNLRTNLMYRSTDGCVTWTSIPMGSSFYPPGRSITGYFAAMYPNGYWRHMGWGQPAAVGNTVHYVYAMGIQDTDPGNVMYVRSTDNGTTWSAPVQLNTDSTTRAQWMPSLAANAQGSLFAGWYDERETQDCDPPGSTTPCYRRWGRASTDNGLTWQADDAVGDVISPLPNQPDPNVGPRYVGDYDYSMAEGNNFYQAWVDGRVLVGGASQQDVFFDKVVLAQETSTPVATVTPSPITSTDTPTSTLTPVPTSTSMATASATAVPPLATLTPLNPTPSLTPCTLTFSDVPLDDPFYLYIHCLACRGIIAGYSDGTFKPGNNITRGQIAKVASNAAGFSDNIPSDRQTFADVRPIDTFWLWIERMRAHEVMTGYPCGGPGESCDPLSRPYFYPFANATRAQLSKIDSEAASIQDPIPLDRQTFADVSSSHTFWLWIERLSSQGVIGGYQCGVPPAGPCDPQGRPWFLPGNSVTRGQAAKIIANTFYPNCQLLVRR
jgi:hypothetical protein